MALTIQYFAALKFTFYGVLIQVMNGIGVGTPDRKRRITKETEKLG